MKEKKIETIVGNPVIIAIDICDSSFDFDLDLMEEEIEDIGMTFMDDLKERMENAAKVVKYGREKGIPIIVVHEVHRESKVDFGRELDGAEGEHCIEVVGHPDLPKRGLAMTNEDYVVFKRRYSAFFGTDLEILLKGLKADTLILTGLLTDICVHYTFVDAHQHDYYCRVVSDGVCGSDTYAHTAALSKMEYLQSNSVMTSDEIINKIDDYFVGDKYGNQ